MTNDNLISLMLDALHASEQDPKAILYQPDPAMMLPRSSIKEFLLSFTSQALSGASGHLGNRH